MPSVYVHFPWCLAKCPYCDFTSYAASREEIDHHGYADAVLAELAVRADAGGLGAPPTSVFFGGGTPSLWEPAALGRVLDGIARRLGGPPLEVTAECNPSSLDVGRARELLRAGVNRLSIGVQSLEQEQLTFLGRLHDPDQALRALEAALEAGVRRVSADFIYGLPGQSPDDACRQLERLLSLGLRHVSAYELTIEPGTRFGDLARRGRLPLARETDVVTSFKAIEQLMASHGLAHYEISNYAVPGEEAAHNLGYWRGEAYLGLGCGAYGRVGRVRYLNTKDPQRYVREAARPPEVSSEELDGETLLRERIMLGLRLAEGLDVEAAAAELGVEVWTTERRAALSRLQATGRVELRDGRLAIPPDAWLFTDDTASRLF